MARDMGFGQGNGGGPGSSSNIRVSVRWFENTIFGGDDVRCRITFTNVAPKPQTIQPQQQPSHQYHLQPASSSSASSSRHPPNSYHPERARLPPSSSGTLAPPAPMGRGHHRASHSISGPATGVIPSVSSTSASAAAAASRRRADSIPWTPNGNAGGSNGQGSGNGNGKGNGNGNGNNGAGNGGSSGGHGHSHRRSLSIVSMSSAGASDGQSGSPTGSPQLLNGGPAGSQHRPVRGHSRASSLQIGPRGSSYYGGPRSATNPPRPYSNQPSPLFNSSFPPSDRSGSITGLRGGRLTGSATMPNTPSVGGMSRSPRSPSDGFPEFKFPMAPPPTAPSNPQGPIDGPVLASPTPMTPEDKPLPALPIRSRGDASNHANHNNAGGAQPAQVPTIYEGPVSPSEARVLSTTSIAGTPRSSGEFYSLSNHSTETLASEYTSQQPLRSQHGRPPHARQKSSSNLLSPPMHGQQQLSHQGHHLSRSLSQRARTSAASAAAAIAPETLMMGYAQIEGSFTLDGSLVDLGPFEQVKRKGVVGGQGGGVVGLKNNKRDSGLLRGFGWGSLATSIGDLLGGGELSTIKEMRDKASSKSVPLLATQQSVLFADLQLAPGESKTYEYVFQLPKGLPPSHRGKVMKISYSLVIGTQRPGTAKEQRVNSIDFPFRVLGSVNGHGEILGHNLMSPYSPENSSNTATVRTVSEKELSRPWTLTPPGAQKQQQLPPQQLATRRRRSSTAATITGPTMNGFMMYVDELLKQREAEAQADACANGFFGAASAGSDSNPRSGLLSPTAILPGSRRMSTASSIFLPDDNGRPILSLSCREAIELAILRSNLTDRNPYGGGSNVSANRFDISRNNMKVATVMLARPAYRLGETITMVVDFSNAKIRCHAVHAALETIEKIVDPKLALRSEASVQRASRKVYASLSEATLYSRRFVFTATIPSNATPEFETTGVVLEWKIRVEFVVPAEDETDHFHNHFANGNNDGEDYERDDHHHHGDGIQEEDDEDDDGDDDDGSNTYGEEETEIENDADNGSSSLSSSRRPRRLPRQRSSHNPYNRQLRQNQNQNQNRAAPPPPPMLEEISRDDRGGLVLAAVEALRCESFEAAVPIRVYGWSGDFGGSSGEHDTREKIV